MSRFSKTLPVISACVLDRASTNRAYHSSRTQPALEGPRPRLYASQLSVLKVLGDFDILAHNIGNTAIEALSTYSSGKHCLAKGYATTSKTDAAFWARAEDQPRAIKLKAFSPFQSAAKTEGSQARLIR